MRSTSEIMAALIATGLNPEQIALMAELTASATASAATPETPEERRKRISRQTSARHRASHNVTDASPGVTEPTPISVSPNVTSCHQTSPVTRSDTAHIDSSLSLNLVEERKDSKKEARGARASRIPPDWTPSERDRLYAASRDFSDRQIADMGERFRNYWLSKGGQSAAKTNWELTWNNWVISPHAPRPDGRGGGGYTIDPDAFV